MKFKKKEVKLMMKQAALNGAMEACLDIRNSLNKNLPGIDIEDILEGYMGILLKQVEALEAE